MELIGENEIKLIAKIIADHATEVIDKQLREGMREYGVGNDNND